MTNEKNVKNAARRMSEHLAGKKIKVSHTLMLEALAVGFGLDNWRELKAVLDLPRVPPKKVIPPNEPQGYIVHAQYVDNNQPYVVEMGGRTALDAAIAASVERLTDFGNRVRILEVRDGDDESGEDFYEQELLTENFRAFIRLHLALQSVQKSQPFIGEALVASQWLEALITPYLDLLPSSIFDDVKTYPVWEDSLTDYAYVSTTLGFNISDKNRIAENTSLDAVRALELLCARVFDAYPNAAALEVEDDNLAKALYQIESLVGFFPEAVNNELCDFDVENTEAPQTA